MVEGFTAELGVACSIEKFIILDYTALIAFEVLRYLLFVVEG